MSENYEADKIYEEIGLTPEGEEELSNGYDPEFDKLEADKIYKKEV